MHLEGSPAGSHAEIVFSLQLSPLLLVRGAPRALRCAELEAVARLAGDVLE